MTGRAAANRRTVTGAGLGAGSGGASRTRSAAPGLSSAQPKGHPGDPFERPSALGRDDPPALHAPQVIGDGPAPRTPHGRLTRPATRLPALVLALAAAAGAATAQDEVPFITTPDRVTLAMLELAGVTAADHVVDLGSGDGRIVITAARRFGASGLGVEIVGELVARSRDNARAAGVAGRARFVEQDLFATDLRGATVVTMYLLPAVNLQLRPRLLALPAGTRVVSHDWDLGDWAPDRTLKLDVPDKAVGRDKSSQVHLWVVPARVQGLWCTAGASLDVTQRFQHFSGTLRTPQAAVPVVVFDGRIDGGALRAQGATEARLTAAPGTLRLDAIDGPARLLAGRVFQPADGTRCR